jgi:hypothetical protein
MDTSDKLDKIIEKQNEHSVILGQIQIDVLHHIKRTDLHEQHLKRNETKLNGIIYTLAFTAGVLIKEFGFNILKIIGGL